MNVLELFLRRCFDYFAGDGEHPIFHVRAAFGSFGQIKSSATQAATPGEYAAESANDVPPAMPLGPAHVN
jgi:hypothetical protein